MQYLWELLKVYNEWVQVLYYLMMVVVLLSRIIQIHNFMAEVFFIKIDVLFLLIL